MYRYRNALYPYAFTYPYRTDSCIKCLGGSKCTHGLIFGWIPLNWLPKRLYKFTLTQKKYENEMAYV